MKSSKWRLTRTPVHAIVSERETTMEHTASSKDSVYRWNRLHPEKEMPLNVISVKGRLAEVQCSCLENPRDGGA